MFDPILAIVAAAETVAQIDESCDAAVGRGCAAAEWVEIVGAGLGGIGAAQRGQGAVKAVGGAALGELAAAAIGAFVVEVLAVVINRCVAGEHQGVCVSDVAEGRGGDVLIADEFDALAAVHEAVVVQVEAGIDDVVPIVLAGAECSVAAQVGGHGKIEREVERIAVAADGAGGVR